DIEEIFKEKEEFEIGEGFEIEEKLKDKCPECGGVLAYALASSNREGVDPAYSQKMRDFYVQEQLVCTNCGLVIDEKTGKVYR
ncbi:MAG: hypothetical protein QW140_02890, partial [Candidatus Aenigmatarchaeota archaeon]